MKNIPLIIFLFCFCNIHAQPKLAEGYWHAEFKINDTTLLPFVFEMFSEHLDIINGDERIRVDEIKYAGDSVFIQMPVYETEIRCLIKENLLEGFYINHTRNTHTTLEFKAIHGMGYRFTDRPEKTDLNISGRWHVRWDKEEGENKMSIGLFHQEGNRVTGTFLSPTGDYRFLEGELGGSQLNLSAFDASHAYLFSAVIDREGIMQGHYFSGSHYHDTWTAWRSDDAELADPESFTFLKPSYDRLDFKIPDQNGKIVSLSDEQYQNKVVLVQLMGTWCSNCLDETKYLVELMRKYSEQQFRIIALDYEKTNDTARVYKNIRRIKERLGVTYPILYAGSSNKEEAAKSLPMLNRIAAYPTTIVIDKKGKVRKIYTGFSGPASGKIYEDYTSAFSGFLEKLFLE
jgi:thiol-disulfide isomerase/thioredoxin